jgi:hypothetical protein
MNKKIISLLILASATIAVAQVPTYELDSILPAPGCTSVDLSPDGTKIYASVCYHAVTNEGYEAYDADTHDFLQYYHVPSSAPWVGLVSSDNAYLWTTTYYGGDVKKIDLQSGGVAKSIGLGNWTGGMDFDSQRRYLYVGENVPGGWAIGSLQVVDTLTESVVGSVTLNGEPGLSIILDSTDSYVYLVTRNPDSETLYKISTSDYSFTTLALPGIGSHANISLSPDGGTAYVKGRFDDIVHLIDTDSLTEFDTFIIVDALGFFVSPDGTHALTMNRTGDADIRIFDFATESIIQTIDLGPIGTMNITSTPYWDLARGKVYVPTWLLGGGVAVLVAQPLNEPPVANAGHDQIVEQESYDGTEVTLDGSGSTDPDSTPGTNDDIVYFDWWEGDTPLWSGETIDYTFPLGEHIVTLVVTDSHGETDDDEVTITVVDTTLPTINSISVSPDVLWPPNHKMVEVTVMVDCKDICDPAPFCYILGVTSNEPINGPGDGNTEPDWDFTDNPLVVLLRAERAGFGTGRVYTIHIECMDASENIASGIVEVTVPHDQGKGKGKK